MVPFCYWKAMIRIPRNVVFLLLWSISYSALSATLEQVSYGALGELAQRNADETVEYGEDPLQRIYYWHASEDASASVIFIHGGCWLNAYDIEHSIGFLTALADNNYAVYGIEYRRAGDPGGGWPGTFNDIQTALDTVVTRLSPTRPLHVLGHSAGGHLALLAAPALKKADSVIGLAAITDIEGYAKGENSCQTATPVFMQQTPEEAPQAWHDANPRNFTMPASVMLLQGSDDHIVPAAQADWPGVATKRVAGAGHFDWLHPDSNAYAALLAVLKEQNDNAKSKR